MNLEIVTPDAILYSGEATLVQMPGVDGLFEVLNFHAPIISVLAAGSVKVIDEKKVPHFFEISGGVVEVINNKLLILAE